MDVLLVYPVVKSTLQFVSLEQTNTKQQPIGDHIYEVSAVFKHNESLLKIEERTVRLEKNGNGNLRAVAQGSGAGDGGSTEALNSD